MSIAPRLWIMALGDRIRQARKAAGLTQAQLAKRVGIKQSTIAGLESGKYTETAHIVKIALACRVSPYWLDKGGGDMKRISEVEAIFLAMPARLQRVAVAAAQGVKDDEAV